MSVKKDIEIVTGQRQPTIHWYESQFRIGDETEWETNDQCETRAEARAATKLNRAKFKVPLAGGAGDGHWHWRTVKITSTAYVSVTRA